MANVSQRWNAYGNSRDENGALDNGVSLLEHRRNEEILEEATVKPIATVMRRRRLEWFAHVKRRHVTENIWTVAEIKGSALEENQSCGRTILSEGTWTDRFDSFDFLVVDGNGRWWFCGMSHDIRLLQTDGQSDEKQSINDWSSSWCGSQLRRYQETVCPWWEPCVP